MKSTTQFIAAAALLAMVGAAPALAVDGSLSSPAAAGLIVGGSYAAAGVTVEWAVFQNPNLSWHYEYSFRRLSGQGLTPNLSHFILQLSENIVPAEDLWDFEGPIASIEYGLFGSGSGNPGLPVGESIFGIKINTEEGDSNFAFDSSRSPMWGDVYGKGGSTSFFYNVDLGDTVANANDYLNQAVDSSGAPLFKILVPDTIPTPGAAALLALGGLTVTRRRR